MKEGKSFWWILYLPATSSLQLCSLVILLSASRPNMFTSQILHFQDVEGLVAGSSKTKSYQKKTNTGILFRKFLCKAWHSSSKTGWWAPGLLVPWMQCYHEIVQHTMTRLRRARLLWQLWKGQEGLCVRSCSHKCSQKASTATTVWF